MSGEDLLAKFNDLVKRFRNEFNDIIEGERAKMKAELDAYNAEKQRCCQAVTTFAHWSTISHRNTQVANLETEC